MEQIKEITKFIKPLSKKDADLLSRVFEFAKEAHDGQKRFSGEPYFIHSFETAKILAELQMSPTTISAGLLHDTLEDAHVSESEIREAFGEEILFLVKGVTKLGKIKYRGAERHSESLRKLFVAVSQDIRVIIIKLSDRLHNMRTLEYVPPHKQERIAKETLEIYVPVAYRLGIRMLSRQLEDSAFPFIYPKEYEKTKELLKQKTKEDYQNLKNFQRSVKKGLAKNGVINFILDYRIKTFYSLYKKLVRKDWNIENIYDISALRIILSDVSDCYRVMGIIHGIWQPLPGRIKDYISFPKPNQYKALHTTIFTGYGNAVEIQIKTKEMHQEAEYGVASHVIYKNQKQDDSSPLWIRRLLPFKNPFNKECSEKEIDHNDIPSWIKELVEYQSSRKNINVRDELQDDFFKQRIFAFTPKGDVIDLPIESTSIDFAYAIHSEIGDRIGGIKINGKLSSLNTVLKNGDIVEIITNKKSKPSPKWLDYAKTTAAKKHIRSALQNLKK